MPLILKHMTRFLNFDKPANQSAYLPATCLSTNCQPTYLPVYQLTDLPNTYLPISQPTYLPTCLSANLPTCQTTDQLTYLASISYLSTSQSTYLLTCQTVSLQSA